MFDFTKIWKFFKKHFTKRDILLILLLVAGYFITRLVNLQSFPIFTDEGIYIHWAKVAWHDATWRFISLTDGKQPLQTWATIPFLKFFPNDPLLAGRLFAVTTGFSALVGMFVLAFYLFGKRAAYFASLFYILTPYFLFYDRMALADSGVNAAYIWALFFSVLLIRTLRLDVALLFGLVTGFDLLVKSSVMMFLGLAAASPLLVLEKNIKRFGAKFLNFAFLYAVAATLALVIYNVQRLSPFFHFVGIKNKTFLLTPHEFLSNPLQLIGGNIKIIPMYIVSEAAYVLPLIGIIGFILLFKKDLRLFFYLLLWFTVPFTAVLLFGRVIFPRYLIFFASLLTVAASYALVTIKNKDHVKALFVAFLVSVAFFNYAILFDYKKIPFPEIDRGQYIEGVSAGAGIKEIIEFARVKSQEKPVILIAEGNFGVVGDMLDASIGRDDRISVRGYWPITEQSLVENQKDLETNHVYIVFSHKTSFSLPWPMSYVRKYEKPGGKSAFNLYELKK